MNDADDTAWQNLLAMAVGDAGARGARGLEARILERLAAEPTTAARLSPRWLVGAALVLLGTVAVIAVSVTTQQEQQPTPGAQLVLAGACAQDPQPAQQAAAQRVTDAEVPERKAYAFADRPAIDCLVEIAKAKDLPLVSAADPSIEKSIGLELASATPIQALAAVARAAGAHLEMYGAVFTVVPGMLAEEPVMTLRRDATNIAELLAIVAKQAHANLVISPDVTGRVAVEVTSCPWRDFVLLLAKAVGAEVVGCGTVLHVRPKSVAAPPRVFFAYDRTPTTKVLDTIGKITGKLVVAEAEITGSVTVRVTNQPTLDVQMAIAATQKCLVVEVAGTPVWRRGGSR